MGNVLTGSLLFLVLNAQVSAFKLCFRAGQDVHLSRRKMVEEGFIGEPVTVSINMIKSRLFIDFNF